MLLQLPDIGFFDLHVLTGENMFIFCKNTYFLSQIDKDKKKLK